MGKVINKFRECAKENKLFVFLLLYGIFYILSFIWLESRNVQINIVYSEWDSFIPFCEYFIIPYFLWFVYIAFTIIYFIFFCKDQDERKRYIYSFCAGMTMFLLVSYVYPNGHNLRPELTGDSIFIRAVKLLYWIDTPTNILPSMHVFVTVACSIALLRQKSLCSRKGFAPGVWICGILIILSTLFLKQHSVVDVILALILNIVCYIWFYKFAYHEEKKTVNFRREKLVQD